MFINIVILSSHKLHAVPATFFVVSQRNPLPVHISSVNYNPDSKKVGILFNHK